MASSGGAMADLCAGESPARIRFLHQILCETPGVGLKFQPLSWDDTCGVPEETRGPARYMLDYYGFGRPNKRTLICRQELNIRFRSLTHGI